MAHQVICTVCGQRFDRDLVQAVKSGARRYAHYACMPSGELVPLAIKEDPDLTKLKNYIFELFGDNTNWALVNKQIKKFKEENNYSYSGMLKSLIYFFDVKGNPKDKANNSVGIIPYVYQDAYNYYYNLFMAQEVMKQNKNIITQIKEIFIKPPQKKGTKKKFFSLGVEEDEE